MGTHVAVALTTSDGRHYCIERTMDGYNLRSIIRHLIKTRQLGCIGDVADLEAITNHASLSGSLEYGFGSPKSEFNREHEQEYYCHIDKRSDTLYASFVMLLHPNDLMYLAEEGWNINEAWECPEDICPDTKAFREATKC